MPTIIRHSSLPPRLTAFRSLSEDITAAVDYRNSLLAELHGHPAPAHVIAMIYTLLDFSSVGSLKRGVLKLRNISRFASEILASIPHLRTSRYQLARTEIQNYLAANATTYGMKGIEDSELDLVSYLITSSEMSDTSWVLEFHQDTTHNPILAIQNLYQSCKIPRIGDAGTGTSKPKPIITRKEDALHFSPSQDDFISPLQAPKIIKDPNYYDEDVINRLADIRFLDHMLMLMMSDQVWKSFITPTQASDSDQNQERSKGLKLFSGYLHSLLLIPNFFRLELFRHSYQRMEEWIGDFPVVPADVLENYDTVLKKFDVLDISHDVSTLYEKAIDNAEKTLGTKVHVFFTELNSIYRIEHIIPEALKKMGKVLEHLKLENLDDLKSPDYNYIMLSEPIAKVDLLPDITKHLMEYDIYKSIMIVAFQSITPMLSRFLQEANITLLNGLGPRVPFGFHSHLPVTDAYSASTDSAVEMKKFFHRYRSVAYTSDEERRLTRDLCYKISPASSYVKDHEPHFLFSYDAAAYLKTDILPNFQTLYPTNCFYGDRLIESAAIMTSRDELISHLEVITGLHEFIIEKLVGGVHAREMWATSLSSFGLLWEVKTQDGVKVKEIKGKFKQYADSATLIEGLGRPWGLSYTELANIQDYGADGQDVEMIFIGDGIWFTFLRRIPRVTTELAVATWQFGTPYYYFKGDPNAENSIQIKNWVRSTSIMLNFAIRPVSVMPGKPELLFDRLYAYVNDTLLLETNFAARLNPDNDAAYSEALPIDTKPWHSDRYTPFIQYRAFSHYFKSESSSSEEDIDQMTKFVKKVEETIVHTEAEAHDDKEGKTDIKIEFNKEEKDSNAGGGKSRHRNKKKGKSADKDEETDITETDKANESEPAK